LRLFRNDPVALVFQFLQAAGGLFFIFISWVFYADLAKSSTPTDSYTVLGFCILCTAALAWRTFVIALMPKSVELSKENVSIRTVFSQKSYSWSDVLAVKQPFPLLPEGFILKTKRQSYLIGAGMDAADELHDAIKAKCESNRKA
jgi:hypothetical protein